MINISPRHFWTVENIHEAIIDNIDDARLMAAAPDLFAALEIILMTHDLSCKGEDCQISGIDLARIAIRKAKGEYDPH